MPKSDITIAFGKLKELIKKIKNPVQAIEVLETLNEIRELVEFRKKMLERKENMQHIKKVADERTDDPLVSFLEAAKQLGLTRQSIYNKIKRGDILSIKTGSGTKDAVKIPQSEIDRIKKGKSNQ